MAERPTAVDESTRKRDQVTGLPVTNDACLVVIYGPELGRRFTLSAANGAMSIGRDAQSNIVLDVPDVSRRHAEVRLIRDRWFVNDLLSTNGTELNSRRIEGETLLTNGDLLNVGGVIFKYIAGGNLESLFHEEVYRLTVFDGLTRLHNKRYFEEFLQREITRAAKHQRPLTLAMIDLDRFKKVNDSMGHLAGDHLLSAIAAVLASNVGEDELVARYGGEEFALVLPESDLAASRARCEQIRKIIADESFFVAGELVRATVSVGLAQFRSDMTPDQVIRAADEQLYIAKKRGRNRVAPLTAAP